MPHDNEESMRFMASVEPLQDKDKAAIVRGGGGDFHVTALWSDLIRTMLFVCVPGNELHLTTDSRRRTHDDRRELLVYSTA